VAAASINDDNETNNGTEDNAGEMLNDEESE
jgi:hypothetical protein